MRESAVHAETTMSSAPKIVASGKSCRKRTVGAQEIVSGMMQGLLALRASLAPSSGVRCRAKLTDKLTRCFPSWLASVPEKKTLDLTSNWGGLWRFPALCQARFIPFLDGEN